mmetsp:Transcript_108117/g.316101  ORF Transcript_108117/g.316101 Transcript_108117/m.316101 type:complete len:205 (+) Transcript_108117:967-1581(+)
MACPRLLAELGSSCTEQRTSENSCLRLWRTFVTMTSSKSRSSSHFALTDLIDFRRIPFSRFLTSISWPRSLSTVACMGRLWTLTLCAASAAWLTTLHELDSLEFEDCASPSAGVDSSLLSEPPPRQAVSARTALSMPRRCLRVLARCLSSSASSLRPVSHCASASHSKALTSWPSSESSARRLAASACSRSCSLRASASSLSAL